jgi:DUF2934 family protein
LKAEKIVMAKRPTSQPKALDPAESPRPKAKRARKTAAAPASIGAPPPESIGGPVIEPTLDDIRRRAYERYLERGGKHGQHFDDWLEAERELKAKK